MNSHFTEKSIDPYDTKTLFIRISYCEKVGTIKTDDEKINKSKVTVNKYEINREDLCNFLKEQVKSICRRKLCALNIAVNSENIFK